jgi:glutaconate CoA-transferase subunit A
VEEGPVSKLTTLHDAARLVRDGDTIACGGNLLHRGPFALVRELARQGRRDLEIVKTAGAYDVDLLAAAGCLRAASCGFVGFENEFGLAPSYRRAVESGVVEAREHACYTVIQGLRASAFGLPFMPAAGFDGSDLPEARGFRRVTDPYTGAEVLAIPPIRPDWALIHVPEADEGGNARIRGTEFEDVLMSRAARGVIITVERIVSTRALAEQPELTRIPGFLVSAVVHAPGGAWPGSCFPLYEYDPDAVRDYLAVAGDEPRLRDHLARVASRASKRAGPGSLLPPPTPEAPARMRAWTHPPRLARTSCRSRWRGCCGTESGCFTGSRRRCRW